MVLNNMAGWAGRVTSGASSAARSGRRGAGRPRRGISSYHLDARTVGWDGWGMAVHALPLLFCLFFEDLFQLRHGGWLL